MEITILLIVSICSVQYLLNRTCCPLSIQMQSRYVLIAWCTQQNREFRSRNAKFIHHHFNRNGDAIVMSLQATVAHYKKPNVMQ